MEYLKDWKIWLLGVVVFLIITISDWAWAGDAKMTREWTRYNVETDLNAKPKKPNTSVNMKFDDLKFRWKLNRIETKYELTEFSALRLQTKVSTKNLKPTNVLLFTWDF